MFWLIIKQACRRVVYTTVRRDTHTVSHLYYAPHKPAHTTRGLVSVFLTPGSVRWICESQMSMNSSTEILYLIRSSWVNGCGKGVALSLNYCPRAASSVAPSYSLDKEKSFHLSQKLHYSNYFIFSSPVFLFVYLSSLFKDITW